MKNGLIIAAIIGLAGFIAVLCIVAGGNPAVFDDPVRSFFYSLRSDRLTSIVKAITYLGNWQFIVAICVVLLALKPTRISYGIPVSAGAIFVTLLNKTIKHIVQRSRPDDILHLVQEGGFSFPSGHSITSMFVYGMLIYLVHCSARSARAQAAASEAARASGSLAQTDKNIRIAAGALTALLAVPMLCIGPSRIYLGVHYPTDVLAGWCLGFASLMIAIWIMNKPRSFDLRH